jgi:dynein assembly factor 2
MEAGPHSSNFSFTEGELTALNKAMKKTEFRSLLNEYVDEISDPKNKEEYEAYIKQLEQGGELPGKVVIRPEAQFCIKSQAKSEANRPYKVFINLCSSEKIKSPKKEQQGTGASWDIPYAMNIGRHDQDSAGATCYTYDCAFHPDSFQIAHMYPKFQQIMCDIAVEAAGKWLQRQKETLSPDYKLMKKLRCKGGEPGSIVVSERALNSPKPAEVEEEKRFDLHSEGPKLYKEMVAAQMKDRRNAGLAPIPDPPLSPEDQEEAKTDLTDYSQLPVSVLIPTYKLIESSAVDLGGLIESRIIPHKLPQSIAIEIQVPYMVKPT